MFYGKLEVLVTNKMNIFCSFSVYIFLNILEHTVLVLSLTEFQQEIRHMTKHNPIQSPLFYSSMIGVKGPKDDY